MTIFRVEAVEDKTSGLYFIEIYYPADADRPYITTEPRYKTAMAAETDTLATLAANANNPSRQGRGGSTDRPS